MGRELFTEYLTLKKNGSYDEASASNAAEKLLTQYEPVKYSQYQLGQIRLLENNDLVGLKNYADRFAEIRKKYLDYFFNQETESLNLSSTQTQALKISNVFASSAAELSHLTVPSELAEVHLKILNNYAAQAKAMETIANSNKDPLMAFYALSEYSEKEAEEPLLLSEIRSFLVGNGILFVENESGAFWNTLSYQ